MKSFIGTDIESIERFQRLWTKKPHLLEKLFFSSELEKAKSSNHSAKHLTGLWCAKEAVLKAFAPVLELEVTLIEITKNPKGYPEAIIHHSEISSINYHLSISISHTGEMATATALVQILR
ncbi:4'-phosphopantetheinyl transferase superfamily protein [Cyclobacteriaceae bacterium YHN15]|nr:4'-phosphopantetheinyl transferase superfamily protein [Cyclobacteriaceae bacterium YHN15]